jgi:hypothetical protein
MPSINPSVESSKLGPKTEEKVLCPKSLGAGGWCYERLKRSTKALRIESEFTTDYERRREFAKFQDHLNSDTLLSCAVLGTEETACCVTFKNGSVVTFKPTTS